MNPAQAMRPLALLALVIAGCEQTAPASGSGLSPVPSISPESITSTGPSRAADAHAQLAPDLMEVIPAEVVAGSIVEVRFAESTDRSFAYALERESDSSWHYEYSLSRTKALKSHFAGARWASRDRPRRNIRPWPGSGARAARGRTGRIPAVHDAGSRAGLRATHRCLVRRGRSASQDSGGFVCS